METEGWSRAWGFRPLRGDERPPGRHPRSWSSDSWRGSYGHWRGKSTARTKDACPATDGWDIVSYRLQTGSVQVRHRCLTCWRIMTFSLPYSEAEAEAFPLAKDSVSDQPCARCGATEGVESHHWAPRSVFGCEADEWPTGFLCRPCHQEWHRMMSGVTDGRP